MNRHKSILRMLSLGILLGCSSGCSDFLDRVPEGNLTQADFPVTANDAYIATNSAYNSLRQWFYHSGGYPILDIMSDDATKGSNPTDQGTTVGPYEVFGITASQDGLDRWWSTLYEGIKRANVVIEKVPEIDMDGDEKNTYLAEAHFLRAVYYFDAVRAWGGVPLVTGTVVPLNLSRATKEETYALIVDDLQFAMQFLPLQSELAPENLGRATSGAAKALLAKVYLFQGDYPNAEAYALEVINSVEYALDPDFVHTFSLDGQYNAESVFEIGALQTEGTESGGNQYANTQGVRGTPNRGWGFNRPSLDLQNSFETGDPRKDGTIIFLEEVIDGVTIKGDGPTPDETIDPISGDLIEIECYNQKVWIPGTSTSEQWGHNRRLIRYADVLLMAAEALNENGKAGEALIYLNQVRARARGGDPGVLPDITETGKDALRNIILNERRHELAMEGHRFWDLVRTGKASEVMGPLGFISGTHELMPIPQTEIDISEGFIQQNPGY